MITPNYKFLIVKQHSKKIKHLLNKSIFRNNKNNSCIGQESLCYAAIRKEKKRKRKQRLK